VSELTKAVHADRPQRKPKKPKLPRTGMPCQPAKQRATNFGEVTLGYDDDMAVTRGQPLPAVQEAEVR